MRKKYSTAILLMALMLQAVFVISDANGQDFAKVKSKYEYSTPELVAAQNLYSAKKYPEALAAFEVIIQKAKDAQNYEELIYTMEKKALALRRLERFEEVMKTMDEAIALALEKLPKGHFLISKMYYTRGTTDHTLNNYYRARSYLDTALVYYENSSTYDSSAYYRMVEYKFYAYQYSEGNQDTLLKYLDKLISLKQRQPHSPDEILLLLQSYPVIYTQKGDFEQALAQAIRGYKYAKENRQKVSNRFFAESQFHLAQVLYFKKDFEKAIEIGLKAMPVVESTPRGQMPEYYAFNNLLGVSYMAIGEFDEALPYFEKALEVRFDKEGIIDKRNGLEFSAIVMINLGLCHENLGQDDKGKDYLDKSLEQMKELISIPNSGFHANYERLGDFYFNKANWRQALVSYDSALRNGLESYQGSLLTFPVANESVSFSYADLRTLSKKASSLWRSSQSLDSAVLVLLAAKEYVENTHELLMSRRQDYVASEGKLFLSKNFKRLYETGIAACFDLFQRTGQEEYFISALSLSRQSKSILFLEQSEEFDLVNTNALSREIKDVFFRSKRDEENLQKGFYELIDNSVTSDSVIAANDRLLDARSKTEHIRDSITSILKDYEMNETAFSELLRDQADLRVPARQALIEFFYGEESIFVLAKTARSFSFKKIPLTEAFDESLIELINIISRQPDVDRYDENFQKFKKHSSFLFVALLKQVFEELDGNLEHLIIVPDEFLSRLPFEVLTNGEFPEGNNFATLDYLIKSYSIEYQLSTELVNNKPKLKKAPKGLLGVGFRQSNNSQVRSDFGSLPGTEREINFLQSSIEGSYRIGDQGTKVLFLDNAKDYDILHLAIHGQADSLNKYESSLIFNGTGDNILNTNDLYLAGLQARLAVLSACESGVGKISKGEGTFSIARGFALVGVPSIVMSLWKVNDRVTSELMVNMYSGFINEGYSINTALRKSKLSYLNRSDEYNAHPYYWAAFQHLGQDIELEDVRDNSIQTVMIILLFLALAFGVLLSMRRKRKRAV